MYLVRIGLLALLGLFASLLAGCGGQSGPTTVVKWQTIQASLPGTDWASLGITNTGSLTTQTWSNSNGTLIFRISTDPEEEFSAAANNPAVIQRFVEAMDYPQAVEGTISTFRGRNAYRMESVSPEPGAYHMVEYAFSRGFQPYFVGAGATNEYWNDGSDYVEQMLSSVELLTGQEE